MEGTAIIKMGQYEQYGNILHNGTCTSSTKVHVEGKGGSKFGNQKKKYKNVKNVSTYTLKK